jgi:hypothetical protein
MHADEIATESASPATRNPKPNSFVGHLLGFLLIMAGIAALGYRAQQVGTGSDGDASAGQLAGHGKAIYVYLVAGLMDWALLCYCWAGVHRRGGNLGTLSELWTSLRALAEQTLEGMRQRFYKTKPLIPAISTPYIYRICAPPGLHRLFPGA